MGLFNKSQIDKINQVAAKSTELAAPQVASKKGMSEELNAISERVQDYFQDSEAILITTVSELHEYITKAIDSGYAGIDTETTGLDRVKDTIVGASLYYPGGIECYIPMKHLVPIFDQPYKNQLTYQEAGKEFDRLARGAIKLIFANADFDLAMIYKDLKVDLNESCYYDVILAWRCLKENERDNALKVLYNKYVLKGHGDPMKFNDFFSAKLFPYCKPDIAKLYAANDAKITYELFRWQLPYITPTHEKCKRNHLEAVSSLIWDVENPLIAVCQNLHRNGIYVDKTTSASLIKRYKEEEAVEIEKLRQMVDEALASSSYVPPFGTKKPFISGKDFNPKSPPHVKYLIYDVLGVDKGRNGTSTDKNVLRELNLPVADQILKVRSLGVLISTFVEKMPNATTPDSRIHAQFKQTGADTGRLSCANPNLMNIPSHATDIRHMFRATPVQYIDQDCNYNEENNEITVNLPRYYYVTTSAGEKKAEDLFVGDEVKLLNNKQEVWRVVKSVADSSTDPAIRDVVF